MSRVLVADSPEVSLDQQYSEQAVAGQQATSSKGREVTIKIDCVVHSNPQPQVRYQISMWWSQFLCSFSKIRSLL